MSYNITRRFENVVVDYLGVTYSKINNVPLFTDISNPWRLDSLPFEISKAFDYEETDEDFILKFYKIIVDIESNELKLYSENYNEVIYNKISQKSTGDKLEDLSNLDNLSLSELLICLDKIIMTNHNVNKHLIAESKKFNGIILNSIGKVNFANLCIFNMLEFEKLINSKNTKLLISNLDKQNFEISEANKIHKAIGLPKFAMKMIKDARIEFSIDSLKSISEEIDGNSFRIFLEFMINSKLLINKKFDKYNLESNINKFLKDILKLVKANYRVVDLLNYLLRQSMYYGHGKNFSFPINESGLLSDYVDMCESAGLKYEKYPSQLRKTHDIVNKNIKTLLNITEELDDKFEESTILYFDVEKTIEMKDSKNPKNNKKFIFTIPTKIRDIIEEGNNLHHCIGNYTNKIITGEACIVFMRDAEAPNTSLITINIDKDYNLVEARKNLNEEPDKEHLKIIQKWISEIKK